MAVGGRKLHQKTMVAVWPTPSVVGLTETNVHVGKIFGGVRALTVVVVKIVIESMKNKEIVTTAILFLEVFILFFVLPILFERKRLSLSNKRYQIHVGEIARKRRFRSTNNICGLFFIRFFISLSIFMYKTEAAA
jgi:hypothetical protein